MEPNEREETPGTSSEQAPVAAPAGEPEKFDAGKYLDDDSYAERMNAAAGVTDAPVEEKPVPAEPVPAEPETADPAPAPAEPDDPVVAVLEYRGNREEITRSKATMRLQEARHLKEKYETEIAPSFKLIRENPILHQALVDASKGDRKRLQAAIAALSGGDMVGEEDAGASIDEEIPSATLDRLRKVKHLAGFEDDELRALVAANRAMKKLDDEARGGPAGEQASAADDLPPEVVQEEVRRLGYYLDGLGTLDQENHPEAMKVLSEVSASMKAEVAAGRMTPQEYTYTMRILRNPENTDDKGVPFIKSLYLDARAEAIKRKAGSSSATVPASAAAPPAQRRPAGLMQPGAATPVGAAVRAGGLPSLAGRSLDQRREAMNRFLEN